MTERVYPRAGDAPGDLVLGRELTRIWIGGVTSEFYAEGGFGLEWPDAAGDLPESIITRQPRGKGGCSGSYIKSYWTAYKVVCDRDYGHDGDHGPAELKHGDRSECTTCGGAIFYDALCGWLHPYGHPDDHDVNREATKISIPAPVTAPFGTPISAQDVQDAWDTFVAPYQDKPPSVEMRTLMGALRAVAKGLSDREADRG